MSELLHIHVQNALAFNVDLLPVIRSGRASLRQVLSFCTNYRVAGIGFLFLSGTASEFRRRLQQSASAFASFLERADEIQKRGSQVMPFFDAVTAGDMESARLIALFSARVWKNGVEYEEDFLFPEYLMRRFFLSASKATCQELLSRWERALQGTVDTRLDSCRALEEDDARGFDISVRAYLLERQQRFAREREVEILPPVLADTEAHLSVEALALLRFARRQGLEIGLEYPGAPSLAQDDSPLSFDLQSWATVD